MNRRPGLVEVAKLERRSRLEDAHASKSELSVKVLNSRETNWKPFEAISFSF